MLVAHTAVGQMAPVATEHVRDRVQAHLTDTLRRHAFDAGWPSDVYNHLNVVHHDGGFRISIADHIHDKAMDLEYGTQDQAPSAVMRAFHNRISEIGDGAAYAALLEQAGVIL